MFSFFKRSKNESEKKSKQVDQEHAVPPPSEMSKNNNDDLVVPTSSQFGLQEIPANAVFSEVTTFDEKNKLNESMCERRCQGVPVGCIVSATIHKQPETEERICVKPCGHGTTGISPRIPVNCTKNNTSTPPPSPKLELKKISKNVEQQNSNEALSKISRLVGGVNSDKRVSPPCVNISVENITTNPPMNGRNSEGEKKNLISQETKFQSQLNDLSKQLSVRDEEAIKLRFQMENLQRDVFAKAVGVDRLESELQAAHKECEHLRQRIRYLENDLGDHKKKKSEKQADYEKQTTAKIEELVAVVKNLESKIIDLETQLSKLEQDKNELEEQGTVLLAERDKQKRKVEEILEQTTAQKQEIEKKWKQDFEKHRTMNFLKQQQLLEDFEWKLREVQHTCKKRLDDKDRSIDERLQETHKETKRKMQEAEKMMAEVESVKSYEIEIEKLRGLTVVQEKALKELKDQQEQMKQAENSLKNETKRLKNLIEMEKENNQHIQLKHRQEIMDQERKLQQTLYQKRIEIAMYWEDRLLKECARLKLELEQIHNEEKYCAMEVVKKNKDEEFQKAQTEWDKKIKECLKEISTLKKGLAQKDEHYRKEILKTQTDTDREILELRRLMDKIDMCHHNRFEKAVQEHEAELDRIGKETETKIKEIESSCQNQVTSLTNNLELVKKQMEKESQEKIEALIERHRIELDAQWKNLIVQKSEAVQLVEEEYVTKLHTLEEQLLSQQTSHESREIDLLKVIDSLKNKLDSKKSALDDLQSNVDTLEGGIQVLNQEITQESHRFITYKKESDQKINNIQETISQLHEQQEKEREAFRLKLLGIQKQSQETINHLQKKCQCLTKLFEEVRLRYERRESRQEDLTTISDLKQVINEQEKDLACLNEEKRYFQMRLISLEKKIEGNVESEEEAFQDAEQTKSDLPEQLTYPSNGFLPPSYPNFPAERNIFSIPEESDE